MGQAKQKRKAWCRCGSEAPAGMCCLGEDGWHKKPGTVDLKKTGESGSHEKCYLRGVGTCSDKISGEHLVSESVLKVLAEKDVEIAGLPFLKGTKKKLPFAALTTNKLCRAHNSALSPLDAAGGFFFKAIQTCGTTIEGASQHFLISGHDLERWLMRTLAAMAVSGNFAIDGVSVDGKAHEQIDFAELLQKPERWKRPLGLYFTQTLGQSFRRKDEFQLMPLYSTITDDLIGIQADVQGFWLALVGLPHDISTTSLKDAIYRPGRFIFRMGYCVHSVQLSWEDKAQHIDITLTWQP